MLPETFTFLSPDVRVFTPLAFTPEELGEDRRWSQNHEMIARLAPGASIQQAQSKLDAMNVRYIERAGALAEPLRSVGYNTKLNSLEGDLVRNVRSALQMLWGGVLFVVLIAAVNIANLSLVRANGRMKELATRNAIGAGGRRIAKQLITEATLLTLIGAGLGIGLGFLSLNAHRVDRLHRPAPRPRDQPRRRGAGGDAGARDPARDRRRRRPGAAARPRQLEQRAARGRPLGHRRPHLEGRPPRRWSSRRWRSPSCC